MRMNVQKPIWSYLTRAVMFLVLCAAVLMVAIWYWPQIRTNELLRKRLLEVQARIHSEQERVQEKEALVYALSTSPGAIERLAREQLGLAHSNETVVYFVPFVTNPPAPVPAAARPPERP